MHAETQILWHSLWRMVLRGIHGLEPDAVLPMAGAAVPGQRTERGHLGGPGRPQSSAALACPPAGSHPAQATPLSSWQQVLGSSQMLDRPVQACTCRACGYAFSCT